MSKAAANPFNFCILMAPLNLTYLLQYLTEQVKQTVCNFPRLATAVLGLNSRTLKIELRKRNVWRHFRKISYF